MNLDSILNWLIPTIIIVSFIAIIYMKFKGAFISFFSWLGGLFGWGLEKAKEGGSNVAVGTTQIVYR